MLCSANQFAIDVVSTFVRVSGKGMAKARQRRGGSCSVTSAMVLLKVLRVSEALTHA
jgi:hypothetical protein